MQIFRLLGRHGVAALMVVMAAAALVGNSARAQDLDLNEIFRCAPSAAVNEAMCGEARDLILNNCTTCHAFVPIVLQQWDEQGWDGLFDRHADRSPQLSETQIDDMKAYLAANFNPSLDPPELPQELLDLWTSY
ncbi:MAG: hypothetical protein RLN70_11890 [Rhodospirillaceae bacterium]